MFEELENSEELYDTYDLDDLELLSTPPESFNTLEDFDKWLII